MNDVAVNAGKRLEQLSARLLSVTRRNKSIRLLKKAKKQCFDVCEVDLLRAGASERVLRSVLTREPATLLSHRDAPARVFLDEDDAEGEQVSPERARVRLFQKLDSNLVQLARNAASIEAETGAMDLYFGYPWIVGNCDDPEGTFLQAPLLLHPVQIVLERSPRLTYTIVPREDAEPIFNEVLLLALAQYHGTELPEAFVEAAEAAGVDRGMAQSPSALVHWFHERLDSLGLRMAESEPSLSLLPEYKADEVPRASAGFSIRAHAVLGYFPQGDSAIRNDYEILKALPPGEVSPVVARLLDSTASLARSEEELPRSMDEVREAETHWVIASDASQEAAMLRARTEPCLVIHGPPGTGKSQVIVNLIADALARGDRVLVCCQKRAALDVVHQRLEKLGLERHVALVHDHANDRHKLYANVARALEEGERERVERLEAEADALAASIDESTRSLRELAHELHRVRRFGLSARRLYAMAPRESEVELPLVRFSGAFETGRLDRFVETLGRLEALHARLGPHAGAWSARKSFADLAFSARRAMDEALETLVRAGEALAGTGELPKPEAEPPALAEATAALVADLRTYDAHRDSLFRVFRGTWRSARDRVRPHLAEHGLTDTREAVLSHAKALETFHGHLVEAQGAIDALAAHLTDEGRATLLALSANAPVELVARARALREGLADFDTLSAIDHVVDELGEVEREAYQAVREGAPGWGERLRRAVYVGWIDEAEAESRALRRVSTGEVADLRARFRVELDRRRELNAKRLASVLARRATEARFEPGREVDGRHSPEKAFRDLKHQVTKKRRLWSIRKLVHDLRWPLLEVVPCWLVSPETLSAAFPLEKDLFDLAIFDEASQMAVQFALPAIQRARRVVIAGDEQQLRPFDLFGALGVDTDDETDPDEEDDAAATEAESILTLAKARFPEEMLACHYRSKYEELIEFSNQGFYEGRLVTAPAATGIDRAPIEWIKVEDGRWEKRRNVAEACVVLDHVEALLREDPRRSVGVITFNNTQKEEILDQKDRRAAEDPEFAALVARAENPESGNRDDAFFVKNIENVQGDERDVIVFSIGYGPDATGRVRSQFGSLNKEGGDNRLNVAVSRARERVVVISSIEPEQLDVSNAKNRGPRLLRDYLAYAKAVSRRADAERDAVLRGVNPALDVRLDGPRADFESPLEEQIFLALSKRGLRLVPQVGVSGYRIDLGVVDRRDPTRYLLGIECDGATYHRAASARERDVYRQRFLESRGWTIHRIWSRDFWRNPDAVVAEVLEKVARLSAGA
ncbi:MAG: DUF4011 domain-containing protein [Myxococcales bacterium]|nr:DUF4011 domain-containing protein [Myxococcales bacterium]